jgi:hypothetical protein
MRPKQRETSRSGDLFQARLDQTPKHELVRVETDTARALGGAPS